MIAEREQPPLAPHSEERGDRDGNVFLGLFVAALVVIDLALGWALACTILRGAR